MAFGTPPFVSHVDGNQVFTSMGVVGTLGTADTGGTAQSLPFAVDPITGAAWNKEIGTPSVILAGGTFQSGTIGNINAIGTIGTIGIGSIIVTGGTFNAGTFSNAGTNVNIVTGSLVGTLLGGTLQNLISGTVNALAAGTITTGTVSVTIGTIGGGAANAAAASGNPNPMGGTDSGGTIRTILVDSTGVQRSTGSQVMTVGTLTTGTLQNLVTGTINSLASGTISGGTIQNLNAGTLTLVSTVTTVSNLTNGSVTMQVGTLTTGTLQNLVTGTLNALASGTITGGTLQNINAGTVTLLQAGTIQVNPVPVFVGTSFGTLGTAGAATWGTLVAASGAGTKQYISGLSIVVASGTVDCVITNIGIGGSMGNGVLARGQFVPSAGISKQFTPVMASGTNGTISFWLGGAGTAWFDVQYWQGV